MVVSWGVVLAFCVALGTVSVRFDGAGWWWMVEASGVEGIPSLLRTELTGPDWVTGAGYGIEGAAPTTVVLVLTIAVTCLLPRRPDAIAMSGLRDRIKLAKE